MSKRSVPLLDVDGHDVEVAFKDIAHLYIRVYPPDGRIRVSAPRGLDAHRIREAVRRRWSWIEHAQERLAQSHPVRPERTPAELFDARRRLQRELDELLALWEPRFGVDGCHLTIRRMRTRWGSCNPASRRISINLELADRGRDAIEYVLVHELAHVLAPHHGAEFKALLDQHLPDWKTRKAQLDGRID